MGAESSVIKKYNWLQSYGRRKGKNFKLVRLESLEKYRVKQPYQPFHLEIGFGYGENIISKALFNPKVNYVGSEVYCNGIGKLLHNIEEHDVQNISIWPDDVRLLLETLPPNSILKTYILFPDPWPKRKAHKRRLINDQFLSLLVRKMQVGSKIIIATDSFSYAQDIEKTIMKLKLHFTTLKPKCMEGIMTRYQLKSTTPVNWFECIA